MDGERDFENDKDRVSELDRILAIRKQIRKLILPISAGFTVYLVLHSRIADWAGWTTALFLFAFFTFILSKLLTGKDSPVPSYVLTAAYRLDFCLFALMSQCCLFILPTMVLMTFLTAAYDNRLINILNIIFTGLVFVVFELILDIDSASPLVSVTIQFAAVLILEFMELQNLAVRTRQDRAFAETLKRLSESQSAKDDFLANVSHELRTPLNTIVGIGTHLSEQTMPDTLRSDVDDIMNEGRNLMFLVSDIVDFTELNSGKVSLVKDDYNITSLVNDLMNMASSWSRGKNVELIFDCDPSIPVRLRGDSQKIYRILLILVNNAVKFTQEGAVLVRIEARREEYGTNLLLTIADTGKGMTAGELQKLGQVYNQADTARTRKEGGVGLGIPISARLIESMNGFLHIESKKDRGTKVTVVIPQELSDERPLVTIRDVDKKSILIYLDLSKYNSAIIRDWYLETTEHMIRGISLNAFQCVSMDELKRRAESGAYTHIFTGNKEYEENREWFDRTAEKYRLLVITEPGNQGASFTPGKGITAVMKPFNVFSAACALNEAAPEEQTVSASAEEKLLIEDASVLVVDDSKMNLKVAGLLLKKYGIIIDTAGSGEESLEKVRLKTYDLIFMDHMMPGMDGVETLHAIRNLGKGNTGTVPIVALTANALGEARDMLLAEGFSDFVSKPIERSQMERVLKKYLSSGEKRASAPEETDSDSPTPDRKKAEDPFAVLSGELIDTKKGLSFFAGFREDYTDVLKVFAKEAEGKIRELDDFKAAGDWDNYRIRIHALKSGAATIGAGSLSDMAGELESAAKKRNPDFIEAHHGQAMEAYRKAAGEIKGAFGIR